MRAFALSVALLAATAFAEQELPIYPGTVHTRIGNDLLINGSYYRLAYFKTRDAPLAVARYFEKIWKDEGHPVTMDGNPEEIVVTAFYTREGLARSIIVRKHGQTTLGFSVLKDLWVKAPAKKQPLPVKLEGSLFAAELSSRNEGGNNRSHTEVVMGEYSDIRQDILLQLEKQGFALAREYGTPTLAQQHSNLEFTSKSKQVLVTLTEVEPGLTAVSQLELGAFGNQSAQLPSDPKKKPAPKEKKP